MTKQALHSDDDLVDLLDRTMHAVAQAAPSTSVEQSSRNPQRWLGVAAATVIAIGGAASFLAVQSLHDEAATPASAPAASPEASGTPADFGTQLSGLAGSTTRSPVVVADDGDIRVTGYYDERTGLVCVAITIATIEGSGCFEPTDVATGQLAVTSDPDATGRVLIAGLVPDAVATIGEGPKTIRPTNNVWYSIISLEAHTFVVSSTDDALSATVSVFVGPSGTADSVPRDTVSSTVPAVPAGAADSIPPDNAAPVPPVVAGPAATDSIPSGTTAHP